MIFYRTQSGAYIMTYGSLQETEISEADFESAIQDAQKNGEHYERTRPLTMEEVSRMLIAHQINGLTVEDSTALRMKEFYPEWAAGVDYATGYKVQHGGTLYKCVQAHTSQADWTPYATPALWVVVSIDEYPEWVQPTGAHDAYNTGDKVSYNGKHYICTADGNAYAPDVYGWKET